MGHIQHKAQAGMLVAALLAAVLALPGAAFGLSTDKATAKPNEDGGSGVIGGMNTRLTWEGLFTLHSSLSTLHSSLATHHYPLFTLRSPVLLSFFQVLLQPRSAAALFFL